MNLVAFLQDLSPTPQEGHFKSPVMIVQEVLE